jgi:hypothetical protein
VPRLSFVALAAAAAPALAGCGSSSRTSSTAASAPATSSTTTTIATPFLSQLTKVSTLTSTVPANGDVNPYGIVMVPSSVGKLHSGALLVSNFNDKANNQAPARRLIRSRPAVRARCSRTSPRGACVAAAPVGLV